MKNKKTKKTKKLIIDVNVKGNDNVVKHKEKKVKRIIAKLLVERYNLVEIYDYLKKYRPHINGIKKKKGFFSFSKEKIKFLIKAVEKDWAEWYERNPDLRESEIKASLASYDKIIKRAIKERKLGIALKAEDKRNELLNKFEETKHAEEEDYYSLSISALLDKIDDEFKMIKRAKQYIDKLYEKERKSKYNEKI